MSEPVLAYESKKKRTPSFKVFVRRATGAFFFTLLVIQFFLTWQVIYLRGEVERMHNDIRWAQLDEKMDLKVIRDCVDHIASEHQYMK